MKSFIHVILLWTAYSISCKSAIGQSKLSLSLSTALSYRFARTHFSSTSTTVNGGMPVDVRFRQTSQIYSVGLLAHYAITNRFSIVTGIRRNYTNNQLPTITTIPDLSANPNNSQIIGIATHMRNYQIPVLVNFQTSTNRLSPYFSGGGLVDFPSIRVFDNGSKTKTPNQTVHIYPSLGAGIIYQINGILSLIMQPTLTYILPDGSFINYQNYQWGVQAQLMYHF